MKKSHNVAFSDVIFRDNENSGPGPGCLSAVKSTIRMEKVTARDNTGGHGGAMSFAKQSEVTIVDSIFESNNATGLGGAVLVQNSTMSVSGTRFSENLASDGGGAIYAEVCGQEKKPIGMWMASKSPFRVAWHCHLELHSLR